MLWFLLLLGVSGVLGEPSQDEVFSLPGLNTKINFKQWSGYLEASPGIHLHYWFVTSQQDPTSDPVVLWLNGGPGCSSLDGFLSENGPFHVNDNGSTLYINEYSWNKVANMLYLESPAGVGFSYSDSGDYATNDKQVAENNYLALLDFFRKFPNFTKNAFYIFGESYGGIYTPTLAFKITDGAAEIHFKGFAVGNGLSSRYYNDQALVYFAYYHGLIGDTLWSKLNQFCCTGERCNFHNNTDRVCVELIRHVQDIIFDSGLNVYSLYMDCSGGMQRNSARFHRDIENLFRFYQFHTVTTREAAHKMTPPCINGTAQWNWLNRADVRTALHIPQRIPVWEVCSQVVGEGYEHIYDTMQDFYLQLLSKGLRVLVYNGDTDMACNFLGDHWFVRSLKQKKTVEYQPWVCDHQIAGFYEQYGNLTFLTIKGAGHMVPQWAPKQALQMFKSYLSHSPY
ncbi:lysosomal protective protein-like [Narcine bancroftii]|uniref:lysosomal protective protein-like n=1 Tax=Narcine bancroftii TaxID=1343680 RepID=UPI003831F9ED